MPTSKISTMFNMFVRYKYGYGLVILGVDRELESYNERWEEAVMKSLVKTRSPITGKRK